MKTIMLLIVVLTTTACGRAGAPYTPSEGARIDAKEQGLPMPEAQVRNANNPEKRFILDGLLE